MANGFVYLTAAVDWPARRILTWRLSITMEPEIFNTDRGSQFTSTVFTSVLVDAGGAISMDGTGQHLRRTALGVDQIRGGLPPRLSPGGHRGPRLDRCLAWYNALRPHSSLDRQTPDQAYLKHTQLLAAA
jgi:putative transposase